MEGVNARLKAIKNLVLHNLETPTGLGRGTPGTKDVGTADVEESPRNLAHQRPDRLERPLTSDPLPDPPQTRRDSSATTNQGPGISSPVIRFTSIVASIERKLHEWFWCFPLANSKVPLEEISFHLPAHIIRHMLREEPQLAAN